MTKKKPSAAHDVVSMAKQYLRAKRMCARNSTSGRSGMTKRLTTSGRWSKTHRQFLQKLKGYRRLLVAEFEELSYCGD